MFLSGLRKAYLQRCVNKVLWPYQIVIFKGWKNCHTQQGFGLNMAPFVMRSIIGFVMYQDKVIKNAASMYIDNICVNKSLAL